MTDNPAQKVRKFFFDHFNISESDADLLFENWTIKRSLKRNEFLIEKGKVEKKLYFVLNGTLKIFYENKFNEICVGFGYANTLLCSYPSFIRDLPSEYYIQAIKSCELIAINKTAFYNAIEQSRNLDRIWHLATEEALLGKIEREVDMLTASPTERVQRLFKRSPHVFQLIPKKYIASYLGMSPETLSRIPIGENSLIN